MIVVQPRQRCNSSIGPCGAAGRGRGATRSMTCKGQQNRARQALSETWPSGWRRRFA